MSHSMLPDRKCPKCASLDYVFRSRRTLDLPLEKGGGQVTEVKNLCKACSKSTKEQTPVEGKKA